MEQCLSSTELQHFQDKGWVGVFPLLSLQEVYQICNVRERVIGSFVPAAEMSSLPPDHSFAIRPWFKSLHAFVPEFYDLVGHPAIVGRLKSILGPDIIAWGASTPFRKPDQVHRWHVDVEHRRWAGVSVFVGLLGAAPLSSLKVISGSQRIPEMPQALGASSDEEAIQKSGQYISDPELVTVGVHEGEFFIFDGPLWHGSSNKSGSERIALIAQYATPDQKIEIPTSWKGEPTWHASRPPCVLVSGEDRFHCNNVVCRPPAKY
jgi:Phytanoyl-CoA dioxygenase (PhyH)